MTTSAARIQQRGHLSRDLIIQKAFALIDEQGPSALSMRRLADHLGVAPNALYTHVRSKADLIDGLIDQVYAGIDLDPDPTNDWPEQLAAISQKVRAQFLAHPAVVPFALQQPGLGPNSLRLGEAIYGVLRPAGFSDEATVGIVYARASSPTPSSSPRCWPASPPTTSSRPASTSSSPASSTSTRSSQPPDAGLDGGGALQQSIQLAAMDRGHL
jgi:Bacterial regulatory proteins, tetR family/Tetracyclin repressor-like, C-terminal domain